MQEINLNSFILDNLVYLLLAYSDDAKGIKLQKALVK